MLDITEHINNNRDLNHHRRKVLSEKNEKKKDRQKHELTFDPTPEIIIDMRCEGKILKSHTRHTTIMKIIIVTFLQFVEENKCYKTRADSMSILADQTPITAGRSCCSKHALETARISYNDTICKISKY
jgi:hypothetical protein